MFVLLIYNKSKCIDSVITESVDDKNMLTKIFQDKGYRVEIL